MYKEHLLITYTNSIFINHKEFDQLFDSIVYSIPAKLKGQINLNNLSYN